MTQGTVGWLCPKCGRISSPYQAVCTICVPTLAIGTIGGWSGSFTFGTSYNFTYNGTLSSGTIYAAPPKTDAQKPDEAKREMLTWRGKYESLFEQLQELVEENEDGDNDEDDE